MTIQEEHQQIILDRIANDSNMIDWEDAKKMLAN